MTEKIQKSESEWKEKLTDEQFQVCRKNEGSFYDVGGKMVPEECFVNVSIMLGSPNIQPSDHDLISACDAASENTKYISRSKNMKITTN